MKGFSVAPSPFLRAWTISSISLYTGANKKMAHSVQFSSDGASLNMVRNCPRKNQGKNNPGLDGACLSPPRVQSYWFVTSKKAIAVVFSLWSMDPWGPADYV